MNIKDITQKFTANTRAVDGGHREWTGPRYQSGTLGRAVIRHEGKLWTARKLAFVIATGRLPEGYLTSECDHRGCVAPEHVADRPARTAIRAQLAAVQGRTSADQCRHGHPAAEHRKYHSDGVSYCGTCHAEAVRARRAAA
ncbi:hypothetical protein ACFUGD_06520 [Streptomyces sp. NPDC057217]|uniref:hypothetical protein n=1 Tax=Streptomyces sp. NPDC057217 TaxID=3346054 RepID=UPI00363ABA59